MQDWQSREIYAAENLQLRFLNLASFAVPVSPVIDLDAFEFMLLIKDRKSIGCICRGLPRI